MEIMLELFKKTCFNFSDKANYFIVEFCQYCFSQKYNHCNSIILLRSQDIYVDPPP